MLRGCRMLLAGLVVMAMTCASVAEDDWSLSKLVPFKKSSTSKRTQASVSDAGRSTGLPKMSLPTWSKKKNKKNAATPSAWSKFTKNTQELWGKTKDALTPGSASSKKSKGKGHKKPWYAPWSSYEEKEPIDSVDDWLPYPRPGMDWQ